MNKFVYISKTTPVLSLLGYNVLYMCNLRRLIVNHGYIRFKVNCPIPSGIVFLSFRIVVRIFLTYELLSLEKLNLSYEFVKNKGCISHIRITHF